MELKLLPSDDDPHLPKMAKKIKELFPQGCHRVLLVNPSTVSEPDFDVEAAKRCAYSATLPYGPALLSTQLKKIGCDVELIDMNYEILYRAHHEPNFFYQVWKEVLKKHIELFKPDLVGVGGMFSPMHKCVIEMAQEVKKIDPSLSVIVGGVHPTQYPKLYLEKCPEIDLLMTH